MASSTIFATKIRQEADQFVSDRKAFGDKVVEISATNVLEFWKDGEEQDPWNSGPQKDWIVILATADGLAVK